MIDSITKTSGCTTITITDDILTNFGDYDSVTLLYKVNDAAEKSYIIQAEDITTGSITLDVAFFEQSGDNLCDGVYCFTLKAASGSTYTLEYGRILVDCGIICALAEKLWNNPELLLYSKHQAITLYSECHECDCATSYDLYLDLLCDLGLSNTPCGC